MKGAAKVVTPMMRLQDPKQTKILIVTLPETTPVLEAAELQEDRTYIVPWAVEEPIGSVRLRELAGLAAAARN